MYKKRTENESSSGGISQSAVRTGYAIPTAIANTDNSGTSGHFEQLVRTFYY